ncbi:MAG: acyltransferase [Lachnospiraceae bacterium]|nr:acyltransferase [Lachnospiraceae bacterium]
MGLNTLSKKRDFIMGLSILWIMLFHVTSYTHIVTPTFFGDMGYSGVDIFILLSGYGCYYSLKKDEDALRFLGRRLRRLLPSYLPFIIIYMVFRCLQQRMYFVEICGNLTLTGWWNGDANQFNWYVDAIVLFYILAPYICGLIKRSKRPVLISAILIVTAYVISFSFMHGQLLIAMCRLPVFVMGIFLGRYCDEDSEPVKIPQKAMIVTANILIPIGIFTLYYMVRIQDRWDNWHYGLFWYPIAIYAPGLALDMGFTGEVAERSLVLKSVVKLLEKIGKASFEIFLVHMFVYEIAAVKSDVLHIYSPWQWIIVYVTALGLGYCYHLLISRFTKGRKE